MCHKLPWPLSPRTFPVLLVTAKTARSSFIVVQIPVSIESLPDSFYGSGRNLRQGEDPLKRREPVTGYDWTRTIHGRLPADLLLQRLCQHRAVSHVTGHHHRVEYDDS